MRTPPIRTLVSLLIDVLLLAISIAHIPTLMDRPWLPLDVELVNGRVVTRGEGTYPLPAGVAVGDAVIAWEGIPLHTEHDMEFLGDYHAVDDTILLITDRSGIRQQIPVTLVPAYSLRYVIVILIVGLVAWSLGVFVLLARPDEPAATALHWSMVCMGMVTMLMLGKVNPASIWPYLTRSLFFLTYAGVAGWFLRFTFLFPIPRVSRRHARDLPLFALPAAMAFLLIYFNMRALRWNSLHDFEVFCVLYDIFHFLLLVYVFWGIRNFITSYRRTREPEERKKLKWLLWGLSVGPAPFLALITIPEFVVTTSPIPEDIALLPLVLIPAAFAISFVKYQVMNVEIVINRTTVYSIVLALLGVAYVGLFWVASQLMGGTSGATAIIAAMAVALAFEPARRRVQRVVDRAFFRVRYDFRQTAREFVEEIRRVVDPLELAQLMVRKIDLIIPVERIAFLARPAGGDQLTVLDRREFADLTPATRVFAEDNQTDMPRGVRDNVEGGVTINSSDEPRLLSAGIAVLFAMLTKERKPLGYLVLGKKKSGARFAAEDIDLLANVTTQGAHVLERVMLQGAVIRERTEAEHQHALNAMKSDFVSNVSHELRTPLTSIQLFTEMLQSEKGPRKARGREYLHIIKEEAARLDRMVATVLDASQIDRGIKSYTLQPINLAAAVRDGFATMEYQLRTNTFTARLVGCSPRAQYHVNADRDAVVQAIVNLVENAIKYSTTRRWVRVAVQRTTSTVRLSIADHGRGIPAASHSRLFDRFFRGPESDAHLQGFGIGLAVVKNIMEAHAGHIEVRSSPGEGSVFTLVFPLLRGKEGPRASAHHAVQRRKKHEEHSRHRR